MKISKVFATGALALSLTAPVMAAPGNTLPEHQVPLIEIANPGYADGGIIMRTHGLYDTMADCAKARKALIGPLHVHLNYNDQYSFFVCLNHGQITNFGYVNGN